MADARLRQALHAGRVFIPKDQPTHQRTTVALLPAAQLPKCEGRGSVPHTRPPEAASLRSVLPEKRLLAGNRPHHRGLKLRGAASHSVIITEAFSRKDGKNMAFIARVAGYRAGKMWLYFALRSQMRLKVMAAQHLASFLSY